MLVYGYLKTALSHLNSSSLSPLEKSRQIAQVPGFGDSNATGLVMLYHPEEFAIWNKESKEAFQKVGLPCNQLEEFQESATLLRKQLGATDFLELDWFLFLINHDERVLPFTVSRDELISEIERDIIAAIETSDNISETEKIALSKSRIGQGKFRDRVKEREKKCRVSGIEDLRFLIASHIKPWRASDHQQRLDGANGLMLSPNIDWLFDKGFISFDDDGALLINQEVDESTLLALGIPKEGTDCGSFTTRQKFYLAFHRKSIFCKKQGLDKLIVLESAAE